MDLGLLSYWGLLRKAGWNLYFPILSPPPQPHDHCHMDQMILINSLKTNSQSIIVFIIIEAYCSVSCQQQLEEFKQEKAFTVTKGWAVEVISDWKEKSKVCPADVTIDTQLNRKTTKFYKSSRHHLVCRSTPKNKSTSELPKIMLCAKENRMPCCRPSPIQKMVTIPGQDGKNNSARNGQPKKRLKTRGTAFTSSVTTEECLEDGVLNNYLKCEKQWKPVKRKCSLLESLDLVS